MTQATEFDSQARSLSLRLFTSGLAAAELMTSYLGVRLGLYAALAGDPATAAQLAERAGIDPRYSQEWLEQQAACGILSTDGARSPAAQRVYHLPAAHQAVLLDEDSPYWIAPLVLMPIGGISGMLPRLLEVFQSGEGIPYADYGQQMRGGQSGLNKQIFMGRLAGWIAKHAPDLHLALSSPDGSRIADVACGNGWSSIALATAYPHTTVWGFDLDEQSIKEAQQHASQSAVAERIQFQCADAADGADASFDLVCIFDALHDMSQPVEVLTAARKMLRPDKTVLLLEPNVGEQFSAPAPDSERFHYAVSVLHCLPVGKSSTPTAATGTVMRPSTVRQYARAAGFSRIQVIELGSTFHRLYRLYS